MVRKAMSPNITMPGLKRLVTTRAKAPTTKSIVDTVYMHHFTTGILSP